MIKTIFVFILSGIVYSLIPEFANNVVVNLSWAGYIRTLTVMVPIIMVINALVSMFVNRIVRNELASNIIYYIYSGCFGLATEWFVIGNAPWTNPNAIQFAMFFYWAGLFMIPRIMLDRNEIVRPLKKKIIKFYAIYSALHLVFSLSISRGLNAVLVPILWSIVYTAMNYYYFKYFRLLAIARRTNQ